MNKILTYLKDWAIFLITLIIISLVCSLINLMGFNLNKIQIIINALTFFIINLILARHTKEKGYLRGLKLSLIMVIFLFLINLIFFKSPINIKLLIYYLILVISGILGGSLGKNLVFKKRT